MVSKVKSCALMGINGCIVEVETDISNGIPVFDMVGLGDTAVRESRERVRAAIKNSGISFPVRRITINLAPANLRKEGSVYDVSIAIGILIASGMIDNKDIDKYIFLGELSLDGVIKPVEGILPMVCCAVENGIHNVFVPMNNAEEAAVLENVNILPVRELGDIISHMNGTCIVKPYKIKKGSSIENIKSYSLDFSEVKGQARVKRSMEIAACGAHNLMMVGSPGSGKTMLARRMPTILPDMTFEEALEITKIYSVAGLLPQNTSIINSRPFRSPHHTVSTASLVGGGKHAKPGEISLAHYGVLFLDELPEFSKDAVEVMRQPLEEGEISIARISGSITYPAQTTLICAANPCKCGYYLDPSRICSCTPKMVQQYMGKISQPLLDRIDIHVEVFPVKYDDLQQNTAEETSASIRERVNRARAIQTERYRSIGIYSNSQLTPQFIKKYCELDRKTSALLKNAFEKFGLSARAHDRILKVARTIADMEGSEKIKSEHISEAIQFRCFDRDKM